MSSAQQSFSTVLNYINGQFRASESGRTIPVEAPATAKVYATCPASDVRDVRLAVDAARAASTAWSSTPPEQRAQFMYGIADMIERRLDEFARAESHDTGKPFTLAKTVDIPRVITNFRFFAGQILHMEESHVEMKAARAVGYTLRVPVGVVACVTPWNYPLYLATWKIAPAMAAGNCVVAKPSEMTPMTAFMFCKVLDEVGLPAGVVNVLFGTGPDTGAPLVAHPLVDAISFTGGTATGEAIARAAPRKKKSMELGGKNANIIFASIAADPALLAEAVETTVRASFMNQGQVCNCNSRILVEKSIYKLFLQKVIEATKLLKIGDPQDPLTTMGSLISQPHLEKVESYVALARREGGTVEYGGERESSLPSPFSAGYFFQPTIISNLPLGARCNQEEIFGPISTISSFETESEALSMANGTPFGLGASVWTTNVRQAHRMASSLQVGSVWINCWLLRDWRLPFSGIKASGPGREGGRFAIEFFTELKTVYSKL